MGKKQNRLLLQAAWLEYLRAIMPQKTAEAKGGRGSLGRSQVVGAQRLAQSQIVWAVLVHDGPKTRAVVHLVQVRQFVDDDIVQQLRR